MTVSILERPPIVCVHCNYANGKVKKITTGFLKIVHEKFRSRGSASERDIDFDRQVTEIVKWNPELKQYLIKSVELLTPLRAYKLLSRLTSEDMTLLWMDTRFAHPESLIMNSVPVYLQYPLLAGWPASSTIF